MVRKVFPVVKDGDVIIVSFNKSDKLYHGKYVLVSLNEKQWIERYWAGLSKRYKNIYPIEKIILRRG